MNGVLVVDGRLVSERKSVRLPGYDYSQAGAYFVTVVTYERELLFLDKDLATAVDEAWHWLAAQYRYVTLDAFVVMPNHIHGVIWIEDGRGRSGTVPPDATTKRKPLGRLIGAFKTVSTQEMNRRRNSPGAKIWQRNYHEHIVRNDEELNRIREYIFDNPLKWDEDPENPKCVASVPDAPWDRSRTAPTADVSD